MADTSISIGVISDTHALLRPEVVEALEGCELILHAGDVGSAEVLSGLRRVAPVIAVRGNNDRGNWANKLRESETVEVGQVRILLQHEAKKIAVDTKQFRVVITGHSHKPSAVENDGVLYLNPGSAGPRRFHLPISLALLQVSGDEVAAELVKLNVSMIEEKEHKNVSTRKGRRSTAEGMIDRAADTAGALGDRVASLVVDSVAVAAGSLRPVSGALSEELQPGNRGRRTAGDVAERTVKQAAKTNRKVARAEAGVAKRVTKSAKKTARKAAKATKSTSSKSPQKKTTKKAKKR